MRIKTQYILFVFFLGILCTSSVQVVKAQDTSFPGTETSDMEMDKEKERMMFSPGELDPSIIKTQSAHKDTVSIKPAVVAPKIQSPESSKTPGKQPAHEDDSILSFNFLYYIFQKYKLQDIVD
jgi:hypothetical protein